MICWFSTLVCVMSRLIDNLCVYVYTMKPGNNIRSVVLERECVCVQLIFGIRVSFTSQTMLFLLGTERLQKFDLHFFSGENKNVCEREKSELVMSNNNETIWREGRREIERSRRMCSVGEPRKQ